MTLVRSPIITRQKSAQRIATFVTLDDTVMATKQEIEQLLKSQEGKQLPAIQPVTFAGKADENCRTFLSRFEQYAGFNGIEGEAKAQLFSLLLRGLATSWFETLTDATKKDYDQIKGSFQKYFQNSSTSFLRQQKLENVKYSESDTIELYIEKILLMCNSLNLTEGEQIMALLRGLPASIRADVISHNPDTVMSTIEKLRLVHQGHTMKASEQCQQSRENNTSLQLATLGTAVANIEKLIKNTTVQSLQRVEDTTPDMHMRREYATTNRWNSARDRPVNNRFNGQCYNCGKTGHIARNCFSRNGCRTGYRGQNRPSPARFSNPPMRHNGYNGRHWFPPSPRAQMSPAGNQ